MRRTKDTMVRRGMIGIAAVTLALLWSLGMSGVTSAQQAAAVCVLNITANGSLLGILVDAPQNFNIAVALPLDRSINVPVPCDQLHSLALAVANQEAHPTTFSTQVFDHNGVSICVGNDVKIPVNGARGATFADCL